MRVIQEDVIPSNTGKAFPVKKNQVIRVTGQSTADFVVFNLKNVRERFDQARTKVDLGKIYVSTGDILISKFNNVMMTIVKDTYQGSHDMEKGMCSTSFYKKWGDEIFKIYGATWKRLGRKRGAAPKHGCWENLAEALKPWRILKEDIPSGLRRLQPEKCQGAVRPGADQGRPGKDLRQHRRRFDLQVQQRDDDDRKGYLPGGP